MNLSTKQLDAYEASGVLAVRSVLGRETVAELLAEWRRLWDTINTDEDHPYVHWRRSGDGRRVADRLDPVSQLSKIYSRVATSPALLGLAESLLGGPAFVLKDKLISKMPQTGGYDLHQDFPYWKDTGIGSADILTIAVALDPAIEKNGATAFFPARHSAILPTDETGLDVAPETLAKQEPQLVTLAPGDAVCFHSLTPHQSRPNRGTKSRRSWYITYVRDGDAREDIMTRYQSALTNVHTTHQRASPT